MPLHVVAAVEAVVFGVRFAVGVLGAGKRASVRTKALAARRGDVWHGKGVDLSFVATLPE